MDAEKSEVERCEVALWAARERLKAAATRQGKRTDKLLAETTFIPRAVGEKWCDRAHIRGRDEAHAEALRDFIAFLEASCSPSNRPRAKAPPQSTEELERLLKAAAMMSDPALAQYDLGVRARLAVAAVCGDDHGATGTKATAQEIVRAGRMRRAEIPTPVTPIEQNDVQVTPSMILSAAKKARGERTN